MKRAGELSGIVAQCRAGLIASLIQRHPEWFGAHHCGQVAEITDRHDLQ